MLAILASATLALTPVADRAALSPSEATLRGMAVRQILASPARHCKEARRPRAASAEPAPLRCRPAPYYVSARDGRKIPRILLEMPHGAAIEVLDKRGRPCHLMRTPKESTTAFRVAD